MPVGHILLLLLLVVLVGGAFVLFWWDVIKPREHQRTLRRQRKENRRRGLMRSRLLSDLWNLRRVRRLTDQRSHEASSPPQQDGRSDP